MAYENFPDSLPNQYCLHWYVIEKVLGQGGFGITYLARDTNLDRLVAVKEYLPGEVAQRRPDATVRPRMETLSERYRWGLERFLTEARTLAQFDHPNIVRVLSVFEANDTAYMVMQFEEGDNLGVHLAHRRSLQEDELLQIVLPILDSLGLVHQAGFIHRDIKPENIHIQRGGSPVLLDFGSARQSLGRLRNSNFTVMVAPGYSPLEQYYGDPETQGPWTDIYGLGATCYRAIAGVPPTDAIERTKGVLGSIRDVMTPATEIGRGRYSERLLKAIDHALELNEKDRPQSVDEWRREIAEDAVVTQRKSQSAENSGLASKATPADPQKNRGHMYSAQRLRRMRMFWGVGSASVTTLAIALLLTMYGGWSNLAIQKHPIDELKQAQVVTPIPTPASSSPNQHKGEASDRKKQAFLPKVKPQVKPETTPKLESDANLPIPEIPKTEPLSKPIPVAETLNLAEKDINSGDFSSLPVIIRIAAGGDPKAQALLGRLYEEGRGVARSDFNAYSWYSLSVMGGNTAAQTMKQRMASKLQAAEIRQADRVVDKWRPSQDKAPTLN